MRKIAIVLVMLAATFSFAFADEGEEAPASPAAAAPAMQAEPQQQQSTKAAREAILKTVDPDQMSGKVADILPSDLTRPKSKLIIVDESGNETAFSVKALAVIYSENGTMMALSELQKGAEVQVNYRTIKDKVREATSIKIIR